MIKKIDDVKTRRMFNEHGSHDRKVRFLLELVKKQFRREQNRLNIRQRIKAIKLNKESAGDVI